jgi:hypothetical protein
MIKAQFILNQRLLFTTSVIIMISIGPSCNSGNYRQKNLSSSKSAPSLPTPSISKVLPFVIQQQITFNLCWAAAVSSISKFYEPNSTYTQCKLANAATQRNDCCNNINACDAGYDFVTAVKTITFNHASDNAGLPTFNAVKNEIDNGHLVALRIAWRDGSTHIIIIHGYADNEKVYVQDPWPNYDGQPRTLTEVSLWYQNYGQIIRYIFTKPS